MRVFILPSAGLCSDGLHWDGLRSESRSSESVPEDGIFSVPAPAINIESTPPRENSQKEVHK